MSVHNEVDALRSCIGSILAQAFTEWELIIVDDHSHDPTPAILNQFAAKFPQIRVLTNDSNLGLAASLNRALDAANGAYIARLDADDTMLPGRMAKQVQFMEKYPAIGVLGGGAILLDTDGRYLNTVLQPECNKDIKRVLPLRTPIMHPTVMARTSLFRSNPYDERLRKKQDYELWSRLVHKTEFHNLQEPLITYKADYCKPFVTILYGLCVHVLVAARLRSLPGFVSAYIQAFRALSVKLRLYTPLSIRSTGVNND